MRKTLAKILPASIKSAIRRRGNDPIQERRLVLSRRLHNQFGGVVAYGPFQGLELSQEAYWGSGVNSHQLLGIYEKELLDSICAVPGDHRTFVEVGAQDGYYSLGSLRAGLFDVAVCFEILEAGRQLIAENARRNGLEDQIRIYGAADVNLAVTLASADVDVSRSVVLCDIEGGEFDLFDKAMFEALKGAVIFIELHPFAVNGGREKVEDLTRAAAANFKGTELTIGARPFELSRAGWLQRYRLVVALLRRPARAYVLAAFRSAITDATLGYR